MFSAAKTSGPSGYNINNSLRFRSSASAYLSRTPASAGNRQIFTYSGWVKRGALGTVQTLLSVGVTTASNPRVDWQFDAGNNLEIDMNSSGTAWDCLLTTTQVFRDPSAWYHIVVAVDTTQATAANRVKLYVNGSQVTSFSTATYPAQNASMPINNTLPHALGGYIVGGTQYVDGYQAEINFIDGQALTPSSFGSTNSTTGVWQPAKYTGTYGTNGFYLPFTNTNNSTYAAAFNGSTQYLTVADNAALELGSSNFCIEAWVNYNSLTGNNYLLSKVADATSATAAWLIYKNSNTGSINFYASSNGSSYDIINNANIGTLTAGTWNHIAVYRSGNTFYGALNGKVVTLGTSSSSIFNNTSAVGINAAADGGGKLASSISNFRIVTGSAVYGTSNFTPPSSALTAITGTQLLTLQNATIIDNSTNAFTITNNGTTTTSVSYPFSANISNDYSGNGNNWIPNNIQVITPSATTYDSMTDVPTLTSATVANYPTLNPLSGDGTLSSANLNLSGTDQSRIGTMAFPTTGQWYFEMTMVANAPSTNWDGVGIATLPINTSGTVFYIYRSNGAKLQNGGSNTAYGATYATGDVIGVAYDAGAGTLVFYKNNSSQGTAYTGISGEFFPVIYARGITSAPTLAFNAGQRPFTYTPPTGYVALNTYNLPTPTILQGNKYMDATTYTGNGSTQVIANNAQFKPDFVWVKSRSNAEWNILFDSVRGTGKSIYSNDTAAEVTNAANGYVSAFNSNGYSVTAGSSGSANVNANAYTYVGWQWQAGQGSTSSGTGTGGITSVTMSVNATAGFSIVTYTGSGANGTVTHGLGVAPKMIILKGRSTTFDWMVYHTSLGNTNYLRLNQTNASAASISAFNNTSPTSTVFSLGDGSLGNQASATQVAYCWAEIAGFSKFGSYTGNGSADGPFVYTGFRPKFILWKNSSSGTSYWRIFDTSRDTYNAANKGLYPNNSQAEDTTTGPFDFLSNGFKVRTSGAGDNGSGNTIIYAAFAENPFKNALAR